LWGRGDVGGDARVREGGGVEGMFVGMFVG